MQRTDWWFPEAGRGGQGMGAGGLKVQAPSYKINEAQGL